MARVKDQLLEEAIKAGQSGDQARARELLLRLLRLDNREPLYWLLMSTAVESSQERVYCLHNVLFLDPENSAARHDLELLGESIPETGAPAFLPEDTGDWQTSEIAAPKMRKRKKKKREEPWSASLVLGSLGIGVVIILLGYYAAQQGYIPNFVNTVTPLGRVSPTRASGTQAAGTPTATRQIVVVPRDPSELLDATYTPTPRYLPTPHTDGGFQQALAAYDAGDWTEAAGLFEQFAAANPLAADAYYYLGESRLKLRENAAALAAFEQAVASNPSYAYAYLGRARALIAQGASTASILTSLNTALLLDSNFVEAYVERAGFNLERANSGQALRDLTTAESLAPQNALVQYHMALVHLAREEFADALRTARRAQSLDVTLLPSYLAIARAQQGLSQFRASVETMQLYLGFAGDDGEAWEILGLGHQFSGDESLAIEAFERALELDPNLPIAAYYRGIQQLEAGRAEAALSDFRVAVTGSAGWFEARIYLAQALLATGNPSGAFFEVNAGAPLAETDRQLGMLFYWRAVMLEALNQLENALADWRSLLELPAEAVPAEWRAIAEERVQP